MSSGGVSAATAAPQSSPSLLLPAFQALLQDGEQYLDHVPIHDQEGKSRYLVLTKRKTGRYRLYKLKPDDSPTTAFEIARQWTLVEDLKSVENHLQTNAFSVGLNKLYRWEVVDDVDGALAAPSSPTEKSLKHSGSSTLTRRISKKASKLEVLGQQQSSSPTKRRSAIDTSSSTAGRARSRKAKFLLNLVNAIHQESMDRAKLANVNADVLLKEMESAFDYTSQQLINQQVQRDQTRRRASNAGGEDDGETSKKQQQQPQRRRKSEAAAALAEASIEDLSASNERYLDIERLLGEQDWLNESVEVITSQLTKELMALEAANVHSIIQADEELSQVVRMIDRAVDELDKTDQWMSEFLEDFARAGKDIRYIESQHQGLAVQTNNQRRLLQELSDFVDALAVDEDTERVLRSASWESGKDIQAMRRAIASLRQSMSSLPSDVEMRELRAVREQSKYLYDLCEQAAKRFVAFITQLVESRVGLAMQVDGRAKPAGKLDAHEEIYEQVRSYVEFIQWLKSMRPDEYVELQRFVCESVRKLYGKECRELLDVLRYAHLKRSINAATTATTTSPLLSVSTKEKDVQPQDDASLFAPNTNKYMVILAALTGVPVGSGGGGGGAAGGNSGIPSKVTQMLTSQTSALTITTTMSRHRKTGSTISATSPTQQQQQPPSSDSASVHSLTVDSPAATTTKDRKTLRARINESFGTAKEASAIMEKDSRLWPWVPEAERLSPVACFQRAVRELASVMVRVRGSFTSVFELDGDAALTPLMAILFEHAEHELVVFLETLLRADLASVVGLVAVTEWAFAQSDATAYWRDEVLKSLHMKLLAVYERFVQEQVRAIEETKVSTKKRGGNNVPSFVRVLPVFVRRMEALLAGVDVSAISDTRALLNASYDRLLVCMFQVLDVLAKQDGDEDIAEEGGVSKDTLNLRILNIVNMHQLLANLTAALPAHLTTVVHTHAEKARSIFESELHAYLAVMLRKPVPKLYDFFDGIEELLKSKSHDEVGYHLGYNKASLKKVLGAYPPKEVRRGVEALYKRMDKHFHETPMLPMVWRRARDYALRAWHHFDQLMMKCFPSTTNGDLHLPVSGQELAAFFDQCLVMDSN